MRISSSRTVRALGAMAGMAVGVAGAAAGHDGARKVDSVAFTREASVSAALSQFPGAQALTQEGRLVSLFGVPMTGGVTPQASAAKFWADYSADFGVAGVDLRATRTNVIANGSTVIAYEQYLANLPVDRGLARIVVHPDGNRVTLASARLAVEPAGGFAPMKLSPSDAVGIVRDGGHYGAMTEWSEPSLVVYDAGMNGGESKAVLAWKFTGRNQDHAQPEAKAFFVNASTGVLLEARELILNTDINGTVQGKATPGLKPDSASNPPVLTPIYLVRVTGPGTVLTNILGQYVMPYGGSTATNLTVSLANAPWSTVLDDSGTAVQSITQSVTPPGPGNFTFNNSPSEFTTAQVNGFIGTNKIHEYFKTRAPSYTNLDVSLPTRVNIASTCNAYFDGGSINFFRAGGGCANTAYADVVSHEYGHFIVQTLGLAQNAFGEGYGDSCGVLLHDAGVIGQDFCGPGCNVRDIDGANKQYPCSGEIHDCGQVVAGVWRDFRLNLTPKYGSAPGLEVASQDHVDWSQITIGEKDSSNGAWPQTAVEALTVDDDDGNLLNGTPNYPELYAAFTKHGITVMTVKPIYFEYPDGLPTTMSANSPVPITVDIKDGKEHQVVNSAQILYRFRTSDAFGTRPLTKGVDGKYHGTIPGVICGTIPEFKVKINTTEHPTGYIDPPSGANSYAVIGAVVVADSFEGTTGFTVSGGVPLGSKGKWSVGDPNGTFDGNNNPVSPEDDTTGGGVKCFITGNSVAGGAAAASDIDGGETILTSPTFSLVGVVNPSISYQRWYYSDSASDTGNYFIVEVSNDNGTTWAQVEKLGPAGTGGWVFHAFNPLAFKTATANMKVRFRAADKTPDDLVDAALDDFLVSSADCACPADFDKSGFVDTDDFDAFIAAFEAGGDNADFDKSGFVDTDDIDAFVQAFTLGC